MSWNLDQNAQHLPPPLHRFILYDLAGYVSISACPSTEEWTEEKELCDTDVLAMLKTFRWIRCSYTHHTNPTMHYLYSLRNLTKCVI